MLIVWCSLVLGVSFAAEGELVEPPASQPVAASSIAPPASEFAVPTPAAQQLDEDLRLVVGSNEPDVRLIGARRLLTGGNGEATQRLIGVLQAVPPDLAAQIAICQAVAEIGSPAPELAEPLIKLLGDQRPGLGDAVIQALRRFEDEQVVGRLLSIAQNGGALVERREAAVRVLGEMGENSQAVGALVSLVDDGASGIRQAVLSALEQATGTPHPDAASAIKWWEAHQSMTPLEWSRLANERRMARMRDLRERSRLLTRRLVSACRENYIHTPSAERPKRLLSFLGDELPKIRALGLELINALITDRKEVGQEVKNRLVEMVADSDAGLRQKVALMVGDLRLTEAVPKLLETLAREPDYRARAAEVNALGRLDGMTALPALLTCLADDAATVVSEAAFALADLSRRVQEDRDTVTSISEALLARFRLIPIEDVVLREKFLEAMSRTGAELFRPILREELASNRPTSTRRAAIIGLGSYGDVAAADEIRPLLTAAEPEVRLAAAQGIGPCGRSTADLTALSGRLDGTSESDPAVRERAWDSFLLVALRLPPTEWLGISDSLARPGDVVAQRRRVEMLKAITGTPQRLKQLPEPGQIGAFERMGEAQAEMGDYPAAASSYEQAVALVPEHSGPRVASLTTRLVVALIRARQDRVAAQRIADYLNAANSDDGKASSETMAQAVQQEIQARLEAAGDAPSFGDVLKLIDALLELSSGLTPDFERLLHAERAEVEARRSAAVDRLLDGIASDVQAEAKLLVYGKAAVLPKVIARLANQPTSAPASAPAGESVEEKLIKLARQFADQWPGYPPGCSPEDKDAALKQLTDLSGSTSPASRPAPEH